MYRLLGMTLALGLFMVAVGADGAQGEKKKVLVIMKWSGSVDDEKAEQKDAPLAITSQKGFEKVWKAWKIEGDMPKIDFSKFLVVGTYSVGSKLNLAGVTLDEKGNLDVLGFGTRDLRPGFRFVLGQVSNDGVKTVNGKALPKE